MAPPTQHLSELRGCFAATLIAPLSSILAGCGFQPHGLEAVSAGPTPPSTPEAWPTTPPPLPHTTPVAPTQVDVRADAGSAEVGTDLGGDSSPGGVSGGPVLWLRFDDPRESENPRDDSGYDNWVSVHAVESRKAWVKGRKGGAFDLGAEGRDGYLQVHNSASLNTIEGGLTIAVWLRRPCRSDPGEIVSRRTEHDEPLYNLSLKHSHLHAQLSPDFELTSPNAIPADEWVHIAFTYDRKFARLFLDGTEVASAPHTDPINAATTPIFVGAGASVASMKNFLPDKLDELLLYARALSVSELHDLTNFQIPGR